MNSKKKKIISVALIILVALNAVAFYILKDSPDYLDLIEHAENDAMRNSLQQKQILSDVIPSLVLTIDIAIILFLLYLLVKKVFKSLKKSNSTQ